MFRNIQQFAKVADRPALIPSLATTADRGRPAPRGWYPHSPDLVNSAVPVHQPTSESVVRRTRLVVPVLLAALTLSACDGAQSADQGSASPPLASAPVVRADNDAAFLRLLVGHDERGLELAKLGQQRAGREDVRTFAAAITVTRKAEIADMNRLLKTNAGSTMPTDIHVGSSEGHGGHGTSDALESVRPDDLAQLMASPVGKEADKLFLNLFMSHELIAANFAAARKTGDDPQVRELAARLARSRQAQVREALRLLNG
ncbi:DUF305 domain-containing protein [Micromonospora sp. R77]|uniref:DUF305 domain-containing protein n=1 Tax=Micromonospora sp. R77 TaxID=2925836 RepID=UPI001F60C486|nr:DUF305 domain-containing protein [Micromonospora sp. R77]MCI4061430.1 DUF305 domain-containing protein [Micromonospora sp. R77]